ncbi:SDR family NAD(P)-dependent oxidoreductase [Craterilacuibacter sp. RT1T]|uniref:SDR family NAD(P)-dependent oxidoreductase n=1 Tax=Craterilacuibacter sp. RT1T TaxID=2942211 RepID=UPI0020BF207C|nr:SDR family NAD(P)-dependent oxidoreductase [Craterilacuibacter sp. RT1T]MCL6262303.1 SDR family oxidoreductase [Craterilacuibacter sp. RT1T]
MMQYDFTGQTVLVTGAAQGIGREIACQFAALGARVVACDIDAQTLQETVAACGGRCEAQVLDITRRTAVQAMLESIGTVDILVHSAGGVCGQAGRPLEEISEEDWRSIYAVNTDGAFWCAQAVAPGMKAKGRGRIILISSGAGLGISLTGIQAYASAKAAEIGLARQLGHELGPFGITVNSIAPGFIRSNPATERQWQAMGEAGQQRLMDNIAMRRPGRPDDIAHAVLFFASDYASWINGQVLSVDGGK